MEFIKIKNATVIVSILLLLAVFSSGCDSQNRSSKYSEQKNDAVGRYQLFQGYFNSFGATKGVTQVATDEKGIFKIDTVTGEVWHYVDLISDGVDQSRWDKIS